MRTGVEYAKKEGFDILLTLDSDLQHDPKDIPRVVEPITRRKRGHRDRRRPMDSSVMPMERIAGNKLFDAMSNKSGEKIRDTQSGFRAYTAGALDKIRFVENGMAVESQTFLDAVNAGLRIRQVPVSTTYEGITPKRSRLSHFNHVLDYIITRTVADSPLLYLGVPGIIAILIGIVAGLRVIRYFVGNHQIAAGSSVGRCHADNNWRSSDRDIDDHKTLEDSGITLKICLVNSYYPPWIGGAETYVSSIAKGLKKRGHDVTVYCSGAIEDG